MTDAGNVPWRDVVGSGTPFCRQVPIGDFVAGFCCHAHRLIVEVDGPVHDGIAATSRDAVRDACRRSQAFRIPRFGNEQVIPGKWEVLASIRTAISRTTPTPYPSLQGRGDAKGVA